MYRSRKPVGNSTPSAERRATIEFVDHARVHSFGQEAAHVPDRGKAPRTNKRTGERERSAV